MPRKYNIDDLTYYIFHEETINNGSLIYELLNYNNYLTDILKNVNKKPVVSNVNPDKVITAEQQVIILLNRLINRYDAKFPFLYQYRKHLLIQFLSYEETRKFLSSKHYIGDNKYIKFFEDSINRIFVRNFYNNLKYTMNQYIDIFKERKINYKNLSLNTSTHLKQLSDLLSDFTYCSRERIHILYFFNSIDDRFLVSSHSVKSKKVTKEELYDRFIKENLLHTSLVIESYNIKKEYLKIFKD